MKKFILFLIASIYALAIPKSYFDENGNEISVQRNAMDEDLKSFLMFLGALLVFGLVYGMFHHVFEGWGHKFHGLNPHHQDGAKKLAEVPSPGAGG